MKRLAVLSFIIGLLSVPIQAQAQKSDSMPGCIEIALAKRDAMTKAHDVFISFKNKDSDGKSTPDAKMASDLHEFLTARDVHEQCQPRGIGYIEV